MKLRFVSCWAVIVVFLATPHLPAWSQATQVPPDHAARMKAGLALFRDHVRQDLQRHCLSCHGGQSVKADFNLATREQLMASGMVGEDAASSYLYALVNHAEEPFMPFKAEKLDQETIQRIGQWLDLGAPYDGPLVEADESAPSGLAATGISDHERQFWSFQPLRVVDPPRIVDEQGERWPRTPIDRFIWAALDAVGLKPNGMADRRVLIRRAYFDLLGLPPTPEEVESFVQDPSPTAYEDLVDRLLESPQYGERWARHWIDVARFAESHGYEQDYNRDNAYHYRDFLIRALNDDLPYDQFVRWQLAGDELAPERPLAWMATGFLGGGAFPTQLTEEEFESARYDELDDMVATTGAAFLGLTIGCARCHDHKYDPIPADDYYRLAATFTEAIRCETTLDLNPEENERRRAEYQRRLEELESALATYEREKLPQHFIQWLSSPAAADLSQAWQPLRGTLESSAGTSLVLQKDGSYLAEGDPPSKETWTFRAPVDPDSLGLASIRSLRIEALTHDTLPHRGPGRAANGNFALGMIRVALANATDPGKSRPLKLDTARATHQQNDQSLSATASIDDDPVSGWAVDGQIGQDQAAVFTAAKPLDLRQGDQLVVTLVFEHPNGAHAMGRVRISVSSQAAAPVVVGTTQVAEEVQQAVARLRTAVRERPAAAPHQLDAADWERAIEWYRTTQATWNELRQAIAQHREKGPDLELSKVLVTSERLPHLPHHADGRGFPHFYPQTFVLARGDVHQKQAPAEPAFLQVLTRGGRDASQWRGEWPQDARTSGRRAALANWITDTRQGAGHLAARVAVNRIWYHHFGRGIVDTPNDFGFQGARPTHPDLLDWLAVDLVHHGWKLKRLHKLIMTSAVYMQGNEFDEQRAALDRENQWYWRRTPRRLEAEAIRDAMLAVSGELDSTMYGPGSLDPAMKRRSVYFFIKRSQLIPMMMLFDWPEHLVSLGRRSQTTTAPQALYFLNSPQGRQHAEAFASRVLEDLRDGSASTAAGNAGENATTAETVEASKAIDRAYRLSFARAPRAEEIKVGLAFLRQQEQSYVQGGKAPVDAQHAALADYCQALLGMNEFLYIQ